MFVTWTIPETMPPLPALNFVHVVVRDRLGDPPWNLRVHGDTDDLANYEYPMIVMFAKSHDVIGICFPTRNIAWQLIPAGSLGHFANLLGQGWEPAAGVRITKSEASLADLVHALTTIQRYMT